MKSRKNYRNPFIAAAIAAVFTSSLTFAATSAAAGDHHAAKKEAKPDIVAVAVADGRFTTLVKAVEAAGLADTLKGKGPYTVFAPTDEAFAKLPAGTVDELLKDKKKLTAILTYHVVPGRYPADKVGKQKQLKTAQGGKLAVGTEGGVTIDGAKVVVADVAAGNGVIHVIDTVLMPKSDK